jgi:uncharacterized C2H2 Zn-finger protein
MVGVQAPVHEKNAVCTTCGNVFTNQSNLNRHVGTKHRDQDTPEAVAKRLKLKEYRKNTRRNRANDPEYREKMRLVDRKYKLKVKARIKASAAGDVDTDASINELSADANASSTSINEPSTLETENTAEAELTDQVREENVHLRKTIFDLTQALEQKHQKLTQAEAENKAEAEKKNGGGMWMPTYVAPNTKYMPWEVTHGGMWNPTDVVPTLQPPSTAPTIMAVLDEDRVGVGGVGNSIDKNKTPTIRDEDGVGVGGVGNSIDKNKPPKMGYVNGVRDCDCVGGVEECVKKSRKKDKTTGVLLRVETTVLTTANVTSFFAPKYGAPRSKEQRVANPRPSVI